MTFSNTEYVSNHGVNPRGLGHWAFIVRVKDEDLTTHNCPLEHYKYNNFAHSIIWASGVMTLTDAKKEIKNWLNTIHYDGVVYVAS